MITGSVCLGTYGPRPVASWSLPPSPDLSVVIEPSSFTRSVCGYRAFLFRQICLWLLSLPPSPDQSVVIEPSSFTRSVCGYRAFLFHQICLWLQLTEPSCFARSVCGPLRASEPELFLPLKGIDSNSYPGESMSK